MFNIGGGEVVVLLLVALLVLGPDKLPDAARTAGRWMKDAKAVAGGFQREVRQALDEADVTKAGETTARRPGGDVHPGLGRGPSLPPLTSDPPESAGAKESGDSAGAAGDEPPGSFL